MRRREARRRTSRGRRAPGGLLRAPLAGLLLVGLALGGGCNDGESLLRAKRVESETELIGGPAARGETGDFLLENDKIRAVVAGSRATWAAGIFGGTLIDLDLRRTRSEYAYGEGRDAFAETFPTLNLIIVDPESPLRSLQPKDGGGFEVVLEKTQIEVIKDGSDGTEAIVRVQGAGGYIFDMLKALHRPFLDSFVGQPLDLTSLLPESIGGVLEALGIDLSEVYIPALLKAVPAVAPLLKAPLDLSDEAVAVLETLDLDLYRMLERLKFDFDFQTDYILTPGTDYVTIRTKARLAPASQAQLDDLCPAIACDLDCGDNGYVMEETLVDCPEEQASLCQFDVPLPTINPEATKLAAFCPTCACAETKTMPAVTESRSVFNDILGTSLDDWMDPTWRSGLVAGDFLFFGGGCNIFTPGLGFDENRRIFENMWQGVGTVGTPIEIDWVAGVSGDMDVSYALVTKNPDQKIGGAWAECPEYRYALLWVHPDRFDTAVDALEGLGWNRGQAEGAVRSLIVERVPVKLEAFATDSVDERSDIDSFRTAALEDTRGQELVAAFGDAADLGVLPHSECQAAKVLIPLFTTSATIVVTHEELGGLDELEDGTVRDASRVYEYERYLVVGEGDIGSLLDTVYELRGEPYGFIAGAALDSATLRPIRHANVFVIRDSRPVMATFSADRLARVPDTPADLKDWDYDLLMRVNREVFGRPAIVSHMSSDRADDPTIDGDFDGAIAPGSYLLVGKASNRATSRLVPVEVAAGETARTTVVIDPPAHVDYRVVDASGALVPAKITFQSLDPTTRQPLEWDGRNYVELGDGRSDYGIRENVLAAYGAGSVEVEPGLYRIIASHGFEFDIDTKDEVVLQAGQKQTLEFQLTRSVDTTGWLSGDFHLHAAPSTDSGLGMESRVLSFVVEGVEFATATDHDIVTDYRPIMNMLDLYDRLAVQSGVETSSLEFGHYNVYPLRYDDRLGEAHDPPPWQFSRMGEVFRQMRARGADGPENTIVQINHPRDGFSGYFDQSGLDGLTLNRDAPGLEMCNPATVEIPCDFDAVEIMNEKRFELIRTPTIVEISNYNACATAITGTDDQSLFSVRAGGTSTGAVNAAESLCGALQRLPWGCSVKLAADGPPADLEVDARNRWLSERDHCRWHREFRAEMTRARDAADMLTAKRIGLEAAELLHVRYLLDRTPEEQAALQFFRAHPAWDPGCDLDRAMAGCASRPTEDGASFEAGCAEDPADCGCHLCVCGTEDEPGIMPECCQAPGGDDGGTGWTDDCAAACRDECFSCEAAPCTDRFQIVDDWMGFLNQGLDVTAVGNSDSHNLLHEAGIPRNWLRIDHDDPAFVDRRDVNAAIRDKKVLVSSGPFIEFSVNGAGIGETVSKPTGGALNVRIRVQTPRWFGVDRVELYRNGYLEHQEVVETANEEIIDVDLALTPELPVVDSWYAVIAYGINDGRSLRPVYNGMPYGHILLPAVLSLATAQLLAPFEDLLSAFSGFFDIASLLGGDELPDTFPILPWAMTNAIKVDLQGDGWEAPDAPDWDGDGVADLPGYCAQPCELERDADGMIVEAQSTCAEGQTCIDDGTGEGGRCVIPINPNCFDGDWANDLSVQTAPLTAGDGDAGMRSGARLSRQLEGFMRQRFKLDRGPRQRLPMRPR